MERLRLVTSTDSPHPHIGRPRSQEAHAAILDATLALLREVGFDALTIEAVAARAGVGKATVYRRWSSKEAIAIEAVQHVVRRIRIPDTGTTRGDLETLMDASTRMYADPGTRLLLSGLVAAMARSEPLAQAVRGGFLATWRDAVLRVLRRGVERGELRADVDLELILDLLAGAPLYRFLLSGGPVDERLNRDAIDVVLYGLAPDR